MPSLLGVVVGLALTVAVVSYLRLYLRLLLDIVAHRPILLFVVVLLRLVPAQVGFGGVFHL